jgi:cytochrome P450
MAPGPSPAQIAGRHSHGRDPRASGGLPALGLEKACVDEASTGRRSPQEEAMGAAVSLSGLISEEGRRDPYRFYARLHELGEALALGPADRYAVVVCGYDAVDRVLCDPAFRVPDAEYRDRIDPWWRDHPVVHTLLTAFPNVNGADHARVRRLFGQVFTPRRLAALEPYVIRSTDRCLDRLAELGADGRPVDFMAEFAVALPADVIGELLGVPEPDRAWFPPRVRDFDAVLELGQRPLRELKAANTAALELSAYFADLLASRRAHPRDDLISNLARLDDPGQISEPELLASLVIIFNAGFRATSKMFGNGLALLIEHPDALAALRADPSRAPAYVEEILRYEPPLHFAVRIAAEDTEIAGVPVAGGRSVLVLTGAANRDPRRFPDPDTFDPTRTDNRHLTFSAGPHYCLGAALGRLEARLALPRLVSRFPVLALAAEPGERRTLMLRGFDELPVRLSRRATATIS